MIILAGDIHNADRGLYWARTVWPKHDILYVAGNHEYYGKRRGDVMSMLRLASEKSGVRLLDNDELVIQGVRFLGATLWTDFGLFGWENQAQCMAEAALALNDFRGIREGDALFSPGDALRLHQESRAWLGDRLAEPFDGKTVVVTHHAPSRGSLADRFEDDPVSACFVSEADSLVHEADLWIHGHTHDSFDYQIGDCRVVCNPRGYQWHDRGSPENLDFIDDLIIEV